MAETIKQSAQALALDIKTSLADFNNAYGKAWNLGTNWTSVGTEFETYVNKFLFPKLNETRLINVALGNSFNRFANEVDYIGQLAEEYVIKDVIPTNMNLSEEDTLFLKRVYPQMITKLYGAGRVRKVKFTLNNNDSRQNFSTLKDAIKYANAVYVKKISDINVDEERQIKAMLVDYGVNTANKKITVTSQEELFEEIAEQIMVMQTNVDDYNEANKASNGGDGRYTTTTPMSKMMILTTTKIKARLLDSKLANTFNTAGIDFSDRIIAFPDLGGVFRAKEDITITAGDTELLSALQSLGDYQSHVGSIIPKGSVVTFDVNRFLPAEVAAKFEEIKPTGDLFAMVFDVDSLIYNRYTKGMLKEPFYNPEFDEVHHWIHYYSGKYVSPFYNKVVIQGTSV